MSHTLSRYMVGLPQGHRTASKPPGAGGLLLSHPGPGRLHGIAHSPPSPTLQMQLYPRLGSGSPSSLVVLMVRLEQRRMCSPHIKCVCLADTCGSNLAGCSLWCTWLGLRSCHLVNGCSKLQPAGLVSSPTHTHTHREHTSCVSSWEMQFFPGLLQVLVSSVKPPPSLSPSLSLSLSTPTHPPLLVPGSPAAAAAAAKAAAKAAKYGTWGMEG